MAFKNHPCGSARGGPSLARANGTCCRQPDHAGCQPSAVPQGVLALSGCREPPCARFCGDPLPVPSGTCPGVPFLGYRLTLQTVWGASPLFSPAAVPLRGPPPRAGLGGPHVRTSWPAPVLTCLSEYGPPGARQGLSLRGSARLYP
uniref:Uncharacterized protein n=1 Tax=Mustela putorius furo TaxID=9669 RepID=M3XTS7_MUSPF